MQKNLIFTLMLVIFLASCATVDYSSLDDPLNDEKFEFSEEELLVKKTVIAEATMFEDFNDDAFIESLNLVPESIIENGVLIVDDKVRHSSGWLNYNLPKGITSLYICSKVDSAKGHIFLVTDTPDGHIDFFNDKLGDWAHIINSPTVGSKRINSPGFGNSRSAKYRLYELRIEEGFFVFLVNGRRLGSIPAKLTRSFSNFHVSTNDGGAGTIDYIAAD